MCVRPAHLVSVALLEYSHVASHALLSLKMMVTGSKESNQQRREQKLEVAKVRRILKAVTR
jgi:hypothetical protein